MKKNVVKKKQIEHNNPCQQKIVYPLFRTTSRRNKSLSVVSNEKSTVKEIINYSMDKKRSDNNTQNFLNQLYGQVAVQNVCLVKTLELKKNQLNSINKQIKQKQNEKKNKRISQKWFINDDVIQSVNSIQQESNDEIWKGRVSLENIVTQKQKNMIQLKQKLQGLDFSRMERFRKNKYK